MNKITIELCEEDRKRLDTLITAIDNTRLALWSEKVVVNITEEQTPDPAAIANPAEETPAAPVEETPAPVAETTPEVKPISLAAFQKAVTEAVAKGPEAKKAAKEIINKYAASVSAVPEDKRAEVMAELANI